MQPRILIIPGSTRTGSFNVRLSEAVAQQMTELSAKPKLVTLSDYPLPIMDQDLEVREGIPAPAMDLAREIAAHDAVFLVSPEYNASIPPLLKNAIDWVSRIASDGDTPLRAWKGKPVALGSASNGRLAGIRGLYHLRAVMMNVGAEIITAQCAVGGAADAFDDAGKLKDAATAGLLEATCRSLLERSGQTKDG